MSDDKPTVKTRSGIDTDEIARLLDMASERVPKLIRAIKSAVYSPEAGEELARSVGAFHKGLVDAGIPGDLAASMTKDYMSGLMSALTKAASGTSTITLERDTKSETGEEAK
jgi:hypothetical protein